MKLIFRAEDATEPSRIPQVNRGVYNWAATEHDYDKRNFAPKLQSHPLPEWKPVMRKLKYPMEDYFFGFSSYEAFERWFPNPIGRNYLHTCDIVLAIYEAQEVHELNEQAVFHGPTSKRLYTESLVNLCAGSLMVKRTAHNGLSVGSIPTRRTNIRYLPLSPEDIGRVG